MASEPFIGQIQMFGFSFPPRGWAACSGQLINISQNTALFSLLGVQYGGDGRITFGLPDLQGRAPVNQGQGPGLSPYDMGEKNGSEVVTLIPAEMPIHTHVATTSAVEPCQNNLGNTDSPVGAFPAGSETAENYALTSDGSMGPIAVNTTLGPSGGSQPHSNLPPYLAVNFSIALAGVFPARS